MSELKRNEYSKIDELLKMFPVVLVLGVRQCGKTSLVKSVRPDWKYFDLENTKDKSFISQDYDFFFKEYSNNIIIDEAQELPELFKNLRGVIDSNRSTNNRFILTGSSSPELISLASDSLAGRVGIIELGTLKINELKELPIPQFYSIFDKEIDELTINKLNAIQVKKETDIISLFLKGGYPEPVLKNDEKQYEIWMQNYFNTYINSDVKKLFPKLDTNKYQRFIQMLSELSGTIVNKAQLGRSIDVNEVSIRDYLDIAHKTFIWRNIPSYHQSKSKSLVKMPKGILRDSGLNHYLQDILTREQLIRSPRVGQNFESYIIEEVIKGMNCIYQGRWNYYYYRTKHGVEVDLILTGRFGVLPIEIKFGTSTNISQLSSLKKFLDQENLPLGIVINNSSQVQKLSDNIIQIPAFLF